MDILAKQDAEFGPRGRGIWSTYDGASGLPGAVTALLLDRDGYLWIGSYRDGLSRYDGERFVYFTSADGLPHDHIHAIFQDRDGLFWFATAAGVSRYDGTSFLNYSRADGLPDDEVCAVLQDHIGQIWLGTQNGLACYNGTSFSCLGPEQGLVNPRVNALVQDGEGYIWAGTQRGLSRCDGRTVQNYTSADGLIDDEVCALAIDAVGRLWSGGPGGVSYRQQGHFSSLTRADGLIDNEVRAIACGRDGQIWIGTERGISQVREQSTDFHFTHFTTKDGLVNNQVRSILQDASGDFWIGTSGGVSQYSRTFINLSTNDGLIHDDVRTILYSRDANLWFGTGGGLSCYDGHNFANFTTTDGLISDYIHALLQDRDGVLWIGSEAGLSRYDGKRFTNYTTSDGLPDEAVYDLMQDRNGRLWLATDGGASCYDGETFTNYTTNDGLISDDVSQIIQDKQGAYWIATEAGVSYYDGKHFTNYTTNDGLIGDKTDSIIQDRDGRIWITALGGVSVYAEGCFTNFTSRDGLASDKVLKAFQDNRGDLWFATWGGVCRYDGQVFQTLTRQDGLGGTFIAALAEDGQGRMWFATRRGITCYRQPAPLPAPVFIHSLVADRRYDNFTDLQIPANNGLTAFEFQAVSFKTRPRAMVYRYRLQGRDQDWQTTRAQRVEYQNLQPGHYAFEVVAVDRDLNYTPPATLELEVVPDHRDQEIDHLAGQVREHAQDLIKKNVALEQAQKAVEQADERLDLLTGQEASRWGIEGFVGKSLTIRQILKEVRQVQGAGSLSVLITGESGTGKELIARAIHFGGQRAQGAFIPVNCSAIPGELAESTLFGHIKGAFTGAHADRKGAFELANGGTLFLDEIGDMPLPLQAKLLRVLEDGMVNPLGSSRERQIEVRVVAATNVDLPDKINAGTFRQDLYFRLARLPVHLPPLRQRREDIGLLAEHFLALFAAEMGIQNPSLRPEAQTALEAYAFPGNVRELKNIIEYALIKSGGAPIAPHDLTFMDHPAPPPLPVANVESSTQTAEDQVLAYVRQHGSINNAECRTLLGAQYDQASYILKKLRRHGLLRQVGERRWARYHLP